MHYSNGRDVVLFLISYFFITGPLNLRVCVWEKSCQENCALRACFVFGFWFHFPANFQQPNFQNLMKTFVPPRRAVETWGGRHKNFHFVFRGGGNGKIDVCGVAQSCVAHSVCSSSCRFLLALRTKLDRTRCATDLKREKDKTGGCLIHRKSNETIKYISWTVRALFISQFSYFAVEPKILKLSTQNDITSFNPKK